VLEFRFESDGVGKLAGLDATRDCLVNAAVDRIGEVLG
jgi:hypothetical protein